MRGSNENKLDQKDNWDVGLKVATITGGGALAAGGAVLAVVTAGAATPLVIAGITISATALETAGAAVAVGASVVSLAEIGGAIAKVAVDPVTLRGWYGGHHYLFEVTGDVKGKVEDGKGDAGKDSRFVVTEIPKLKVHWSDSGRNLQGNVG